MDERSRQLDVRGVEHHRVEIGVAQQQVAADTQEAWMDASDGAIGRKLVAIGRHSPLELVDTLAWVILDTAFQQDGPGHAAVRGIAATVRREGCDELAASLGEWIGDLQSRAKRGEFLFSVNDYAVLLRKPSGAHS